MGERREREGEKERSDQGRGEGGKGIIKWARQTERAGAPTTGGCGPGIHLEIPPILRTKPVCKIGVTPLPFSVFWADERTSSSRLKSGESTARSNLL